MSAHRRLAERVLRLEADAILGLIPRLDARFDRAVALLSAPAGRVIVTGMGKSGIIGRKIAATLASTGTPSHFLHPAEGVHGDLGMVARGDVVLALSNSGETDEVLAILPPLKRLGVPLVLLTGNPVSTLARQCEVVLDVSVPEEACPMNLAPTCSTTAALAMGDALAMALLELRGLRADSLGVLAPLTLLGANTIGNVPLVVLLLSVAPALSEGAYYALAVLSTLAGNLLVVGSLANIIALERARDAGVRLSFAEHAKCGVPMTLLSLLLALGWLYVRGYVAP
ncbi:MAG: SIS domain-containing protein [Burkholderiales bacterium]